MSLTSKIILTAAGAFSGGVMFWVFYQQEQDRKKMHAGVERDIERQRLSKLEKSQTLDQINYPKVVNAESSDDKVLRELVGANKT